MQGGGKCGGKEQGKGGEEGDGENGEVKGKGTAWSENQIYHGYGSVVIYMLRPLFGCVIQQFRSCNASSARRPFSLDNTHICDHRIIINRPRSGKNTVQTNTG